MPEPQAKTLLGFDFGEKRIGIAVGQTLTGSVTPLTTLTAIKQKPDWDGISALIKEWQPDLLILGLPLHMDGSEQTITQRVKRFGHQLEGRYNLPVEWVDERLSSYDAEQQLREQGKRSNKKDIDKLAAALILQSWLEQQGNL
ncbi:MAG: Holliday junction resolvase RuvX [Gammaproteobacteria bacterium]|nr:Holliday junction resolvase RuvX [Gammaproteobacteria bacterium]